MTLTWEQPENNGGSPVIGYMVERKPADSTRWTKVNKKSLSDTMFTAMDLVEGSKYEFRVSAENAAGIGKPSQPTGPILAKNQFGKKYNKRKFLGQYLKQTKKGSVNSEIFVSIYHCDC